MSAAVDQAVVASYRNHSEAEMAVRRLSASGLPINQVSIIGRNFETHEDIQGFYRPADAALEGAQQGAWFGGLFGLMLGAMGFFVKIRRSSTRSAFRLGNSWSSFMGVKTRQHALTRSHGT